MPEYWNGAPSEEPAEIGVFCGSISSSKSLYSAHGSSICGGCTIKGAIQLPLPELLE
jgi:hypothetical protein